MKTFPIPTPPSPPILSSQNSVLGYTSYAIKAALLQTKLCQTHKKDASHRAPGPAKCGQRQIQQRQQQRRQQRQQD